jgi:ABC-2 type transport system permease protein
LFGYGLSLDVKNVPVAVVIEYPAADALELAGGFQLSPYFKPVMLRSMPPAQQLLLEHRVDGIVRIPADFPRRVAAGNADVQLIVHGGDANRARIIEGYVQGVVAAWWARLAAQGQPGAIPPVGVQARLWFNEADDSRYFLVPGLIVLVMTLIGGLLTAMVMAREWERGTLESLFVTPVRSDEILLGKTIPYFVLSFGIGLLISSWVKNQLVASQLTMLITFMPAFMLSGFLFDLRSMPTAVRLITYVLPARYYVALLQSVFLAGDVWSVILPNTLVLALMAIALALGSRAVMSKRLA